MARAYSEVRGTTWGQPGTKSKVLSAPVHCYDRPDGAKFRGGQTMAIADDDVTVRVQMEQAYARDRVLTRKFIDQEPEDTRAPICLGAPVVVRVEGNTPDDFEIVAIRGGRHIGVGDEEAVVRAGRFAPSVLNGIIGGVAD